MENEFDGKVSNYNEATLKMQRIHDSQRIMNGLRSNMLDVLGDNKHGYDVFINELLSLLMEVRGKMSTEEKIKMVKWRNLITNLLEVFPPFELHKSETGIKYLKLNCDNWSVLRSAMFELEDFVRDMLESHGLSSPNQDTEELWE